MKKAIELIETREGCAIAETTPRYIVMFRGHKFGELYFNMTGYTGSYLPSPGLKSDDPVPFHIGERSISAYRKEIARFNRRWAEIDKEALWRERRSLAGAIATPAE
jgi:hypothetical protein